MRYSKENSERGKWCVGHARPDQKGTHYPYDPEDDTHKYDPANDPGMDDEPRFINDLAGYPEMIDPATGLQWGVDPATGEEYEDFTWFTDEDDEPRDPMYDEEFKFPENPATPGFNYGIDPTTNQLWFNQLIDSSGNP